MAGMLQGNITAVAAGGHSLAVTSLGEIYSWGRNDSKGGGGGGSPGIADSGQLGGFYRAAVPAESPGKVCLAWDMKREVQPASIASRA